MTDADLMAAARMRIVDRRSWAEIGQRLAYDPAHIQRAVKARLFRHGGTEIVYPALRGVIESQYFGSLSKFAEALGFSRQFMHQSLTGDIPISPHLLREMQAATGLSEAEILEKEEIDV